MQFAKPLSFTANLALNVVMSAIESWEHLTFVVIECINNIWIIKIFRISVKKTAFCRCGRM